MSEDERRRRFAAATQPASEMLKKIATPGENTKAAFDSMDRTLPLPSLPDPPEMPPTPGLDALRDIEAKLDQVIVLLKLLLEKQGHKGTTE